MTTTGSARSQIGGLSETIAHYHYKTESAWQSKCANRKFVLALSDGQKDYSIQQPESDEV